MSATSAQGSTRRPERGPFPGKAPSTAAARRSSSPAAPAASTSASLRPSRPRARRSAATNRQRSTPRPPNSAAPLAGRSAMRSTGATTRPSPPPSPLRQKTSRAGDRDQTERLQVRGVHRPHGHLERDESGQPAHASLRQQPHLRGRRRFRWRWRSTSARPRRRRHGHPMPRDRMGRRGAAGEPRGTRSDSRHRGHRASSPDDAARSPVAAFLPLERLGQPDDLAAACLFLGSETSAYANGAVLPADGDWSLRGAPPGRPEQATPDLAFAGHCG